MGVYGCPYVCSYVVCVQYGECVCVCAMVCARAMCACTCLCASLLLLLLLPLLSSLLLLLYLRFHELIGWCCVVGVVDPEGEDVDVDGGGSWGEEQAGNEGEEEEEEEGLYDNLLDADDALTRRW